MMLSIVDQSQTTQDEKLKCLLFAKEESKLPPAQVGDVIRFHRLMVNESTHHTSHWDSKPKFNSKSKTLFLNLLNMKIDIAVQKQSPNTVKKLIYLHKNKILSRRKFCVIKKVKFTCFHESKLVIPAKKAKFGLYTFIKVKL